MREVDPLRQREVETYFEVVAERGADVGVEAFASHNLGVFAGSDFAALSDALRGADASAAFAFLGRDADEQAEVIAAVDDAGHEIVLHGQRHVACGDLPERLARENVETGLASIEAASGVRPSTFFAPLGAMNAATLEALVDAGIDRAVGRAETVPPADLTVIEPAPVVDLELLMGGHSPDEAFERLSSQAEAGGVFLMHPNLIEHFGATDQFRDWIDAFRPTGVAEWIETGGVGLLVDAVRPLRIE